MNDPIIEEIRRIRDEHSKLFNYDLDAICEEYKKHQLNFSDRLVRLLPNRCCFPEPQNEMAENNLLVA